MGSNNKKTFLQYEISYKFRQINLVADLATLNEMKNRIQ